MAVRWEKLTVKAQEAVQAANELATDAGNPESQPIHLLQALLGDKEGIVPSVLSKIGAPIEQLRDRLRQVVSTLPRVSGASHQAQASSIFLKVLDQAFREAQNFKDEYVSTEHLLLAMTQEKNEPALISSCASTPTKATTPTPR